MKFIPETFTNLPTEVVKTNRHVFEDKFRRQYIKYCAYKHLLDDVLTKAELKTAKSGHLPEFLDIHHVWPLSGFDMQDVNDFHRLCIMHKITHKAINKNVFGTQLKGLTNAEPYAKADIWLPVFDAVDTDRIVALRTGDTHLPADIKYGVQVLNAEHGIITPDELFKRNMPTKKEFAFLFENLSFDR